MRRKLLIEEFEDCCRLPVVRQLASDLEQLYSLPTEGRVVTDTRLFISGQTLYLLEEGGWPAAQPYIRQLPDVGPLHEAARRQAAAVRNMIDFSGVRLLVGHGTAGSVGLVLSDHLDLPCVSFGAPAVYRRPQAGGLLDLHCRVVHNGDPAASLPGGFYHRATEQLFLGPPAVCCLLQAAASGCFSAASRWQLFHPMATYHQQLIGGRCRWTTT